jgi:release factor glutamine methyltransferase
MNKDNYLSQLDEDQIHVTTRPYLNKVNSHTEPYTMSVFGKDLIVLPGVMSPKYDWAGVYMIDYLPKDFSGQDVLELGPGTGLVSVFVGLRGAKSVTALDINPVAVQNTNVNFEKCGLGNARAYVSDVFSKVKGQKFNSIIFNLPYHNGTPQNDLEKGVIDEDYRAMKSFFADAVDYLRPGGVLYVGFSRSGDLEKFHSELNKNKLEIQHMEEKNTWEDEAYSGSDFHYNCQVYTIVPK